MIYDSQKLAWIIGYEETNDQRAIKKAVEHLEEVEARTATQEEIAELSSAVRRILADRDNALVYGDTTQEAFHAGPVMHDFLKEK